MNTRIAHLTAAFAIAGMSAASAAPGDIGVAAPLSGNFAALGLQMTAGAGAARGDARLEIVDDRCEAAGGADAARRFVEAEVAIVVGFLCTEAIDAALPILSAAGIPVITPAIRTDSLTDRRERDGHLVWRLAPRADAEQAALADILGERWRESFFAIVDDGTIYGRELAEAFRFAAEERGLEPVLVDTYRPQLENQIALAGRLRRAGAENVFVGGERDDAAILARDAIGLDYALTVAGGEALRADGAVDIPAGVLMVGLPLWQDVADPETVARFRNAGREPEGYVLPSYAAMQVARAAVASAGSGGSLADALSGGAFSTTLGPVRFDEKGDWQRSFYGLFRHDGTNFVSVEAE